MAPRYTLDAPGQDRYISRCTNLEGAVSPYRVIVEWDEDARVWVASSEDVPGLATGADTLEDLIEKRYCPGSICPGSIMRFGNWHRQIFLDSGILFRFKDS